MKFRDQLLVRLVFLATWASAFIIPDFDEQAVLRSFWEKSSLFTTLWNGESSTDHSPVAEDDHVPLNVFITGATGYIGGEFLHKLINHESYKFNVTALVRSQTKADLLLEATENVIYPVIGDLDSSTLLRDQFERADIIVNAATNNHLASTQLLKEVLSVKEGITLLFHIAGVSILSTRNQTDTRVWSDIDDNRQIHELPDDRPHIEIDKTIMNIKNQNPEYIRPVIISPATIYGTSEGYDNRRSVQVPVLVRKSIELGQAFTVEDGQYRWSNVHICDLGSMFILLLEKLIEDRDSIRTGDEGYHFVETGSHTWFDVSQMIGELLYEMEAINTTVVEMLYEEEADKLFGSPISSLYDTNALVRADLARSYGWEPTHSGEFWQSVEVSVGDELGVGDD